MQGEDDEDFAWQKPLDESEDLVALAEFAVQQAQDRMPSGLELPELELDGDARAPHHQAAAAVPHERAQDNDRSGEDDQRLRREGEIDRVRGSDS